MKRLYDAFKQLKNDNDFSVCGRADEAHTRDLPPCFEQSNKYAAVVVGSYKIQDLTQVLSSKAPVVVAFARHPRERMASLHLALVTMEAIQQCLGSVDFSGKGPGHSPSCFMTEGHDVDNADAKWLCGSSQCHTVDEGLGRGLVISAVRGAGRQISSCCGGIGKEAARALPGAEEGLPRPEESIEERDGRPRVAGHEATSSTSTTTKRRASGTRRARRTGSTRRSRTPSSRRIRSIWGSTTGPSRRWSSARRSARGDAARSANHLRPLQCPAGCRGRPSRRNRARGAAGARPVVPAPGRPF